MTGPRIKCGLFLVTGSKCCVCVHVWYSNELHVVCEQLQPSTAAQKPTGKVVGIIKRNWRPFCGMLNVSQIKEVRVNCPQMYYVVSYAVDSICQLCAFFSELTFCLLFYPVDQTPFHPRRTPYTTNTHRDPPGISAGRSEDHGGHRWLAQTFQIPKCELEVYRPLISWYEEVYTQYRNTPHR